MPSDDENSFEGDSLHSETEEKRDDENSIEQLLKILKNFQPTKTRACTASKSSDKNFCDVLGSTLAITSRIMKRLEFLEAENQTLKSRITELEAAGSSQIKTFASVAASQEVVGTSTPKHSNNRRQSGIGLFSLETKVDDLEQHALANALSIQGAEIDRFLSSNRTEPPSIGSCPNTRTGKISTDGNTALNENLTAVRKGGDAYLRSAVLNLLQANCDDTLHASDISSVNVIGREKKFLKVTLVSKYQRDKVLRFIKASKPKDIYVSEFLTKNRSRLFFKARAIKKENDCVDSVYVREGAILCKVRNRDRPYHITNDEHFQQLLSTIRKN